MQTAFVTGGTGGIGSAVVRKSVAEGVRVGFFGRNAEVAQALIEELGETTPSDNFQVI